MLKVAGEHPFCVLIYMNSYTFHICFILFILLSYLIFDFVCLTLSSSEHTQAHKYTHTQTHTHTHTHTQNLHFCKKKQREIFRAHTRAQTHTHTLTHTRAHTLTHTRAHTHTHLHMHIHTLTHKTCISVRRPKARSSPSDPFISIIKTSASHQY